MGIRATHSLGCGMSTTPEGSEDSYVLVAPAAAPSRPPNKAQLRTIKRQVAARRKQGEEVQSVADQLMREPKQLTGYCGHAQSGIGRLWAGIEREASLGCAEHQASSAS